MITFNQYQQAVVDFRQGYGVVVAGPGAGKTQVFVTRIRQLLDEGVPPEELLALTFTSDAAKEMAKRANVQTEHKIFSTFHSWALAFIKQEALSLPFQVHHDFHGMPAPLCLPQDAARTLAQICRRLPKVEWKDAASYISFQKRRGISPVQAGMNAKDELGELYAKAYQKYDEALRSKGLLDFDSIVIEAVNLLERRFDVREAWQFRFVMTDEAQDTDTIQFRVLKAITEKYGNLLCVGDDNQSIYGWRGSVANLTEHFLVHFPNAKVFSLPENFRSTQAIVSYCKDIAPIQNETVINFHTRNHQGTEPEFRLFEREDEEAKSVVNSCTNPTSTAILARTNRQLAIFEDELSQRGLRYKLLGKSGYWSQHEVRDAIGIIAGVAIPSDANVLKLLAAKSEATKFLRKKDSGSMPSTISLLKEFQQYNPDRQTGASKKLHSLLQQFTSGETHQDEILHNIGRTIHALRGQIKSLTASAGVQSILDAFGVQSVYDAADDDGKYMDNDPLENINKLVEIAGRFATVDEFYEHTQRARRAAFARTKCITLSTVHQAKGREWENVFVVGVNQDIFPHIKADLEEEKKTYFVACSRAANYLQVSANGVASEFIRDHIPDNNTATDFWEGFQLQP